MLISYNPTLIVSQSYNWDADDAVRERMVFFSRTRKDEYEKKIKKNSSSKDSHSKCDMMLRVVKCDEGYKLVVRGPSGELIWETPYTLEGDVDCLMNALIRFMFPGWTVECVTLKNVPDKLS